MSDDLVISTAQGGPNSAVPNGTRFSLAEIATLNGEPVTPALLQRIIMSLRTADGTALDVTDATPLPVSLASTPLAADAATETSLAALLAKVIAAPSTEAKQDAMITLLDAIGGLLAGTLAIGGAVSVDNHPSAITANAGTDLNTSSLALESGGVLDDISSAIAALNVLVDELATAAETQPVSLDSVPSHDVTNAGIFPVQASLPKGAKTLDNKAPDTTATSLLGSNADRKQAILYNNGSVTVYLGKDDTVTSSTGLPLVAGASLTDEVSTDAWWGITASGTGDIRVIEVT